MADKDKDAEAMEEAAAEIARLAATQDRQHAGRTYAGRYAESIRRLAKLAGAGGGKLVVHIIGVGSKDGPQVREAIEALKATGRELEVHLMDIQPELLKSAAESARGQFPGVKFVPHEVDIALPRGAPISRADIAICTNVMLHISPTSHLPLGLHALSSLMKKDGYALVDSSDVGNPAASLKEHGLEVKDLVIERHSDKKDSYAGVGMILRKIAEPAPFHKVWGGIKERKEAVRRRVLGKGGK